MNKKILVMLVFVFVILLVATLIPKNNWKDPKGKFMEVKIEQLDTNGKSEYVWFECPSDQLESIERGYRECMQSVVLTQKTRMWKNNRLTVKTDRETVHVYIVWTNDYVLFEGGLLSKEFRQVLTDVGFIDAGSEEVIPVGMTPIEIPDGPIPTDEEMEPLMFKE